MFNVKSGVPQGSHLGPLLFILFIGDFGNCFQYVKFLLYADDLKIFFQVRDVLDCNLAQLELDKFAQWCTDNKLKLNISKCKFISFSRSKTIHHFVYNLSGCVLDNTDTINDLGVILDNKLTFVPHLDATISKASKMLGFIKRIGKEFRDVHALKTLYISLVRSILEYAGVIWNPYYRNHSDRIERIQRRFVRFALRNFRWIANRQLPPYCQRSRLIDLDPLYVRRQIACILFVNDVLSNKYDCPVILSNLSLLVYQQNVRSRVMFREDRHRTNYGANEPLNAAIRSFNRFSNIYEFGVGRGGFRAEIRRTLLNDPCTCC
jgi:Reverse transcriptase (RNA-dependent DNA polymerase)